MPIDVDPSKGSLEKNEVAIYLSGRKLLGEWLLKRGLFFQVITQALEQAHNRKAELID